MTFPVSQSVLNADALTKELIVRYGLEGDVRCRLLSRGMNDIYRIEHARGPHALKVARAGKSSLSEFSYEQEYIQYLHDRGFSVPAAAPLLDGSKFFTVDAPEGERHIVMMRWLAGTPVSSVITDGQAFDIGELLARMHVAAAEFKSPHSKWVNSEEKLIKRLPYLLAMAEPGSEERAFLEGAGNQVLQTLALVHEGRIPYGPCHGDIQYANVMILDAGGLGVFDFSDCGFDPLVKDLAAFDWRSDFDKCPQSINIRFAEGYDSVRSRTEEEVRLHLLYRVLRHFFIMSTMAQYVNRIGPVAGFDKNMAHYMDMARQYCRDAGIV